MPYNPILIDRAEGVVTLRFNRPAALNAIDRPMAEAFLAAIEQIAADPTLRVIVLAGEGRGFMAGGDLSVFRDATDLPEATNILIPPLHRAVTLMQRAPQIVVAALHGPVAGAGMSLALMADLAIATDDARLNMAYARINAVPDCGGSWALARLVGYRKAMEIALLSPSLSAADALALGLVNRVVPAADLQAEVAALARELAARAPASTLGIRDLLRAAPGRDLPDQLEAERLGFRAAAASPEFARSIAAFFAR